MPTHLYCLLPAESDLTPSLPGVRVLRAPGGVIAWISDAPASRLSRDARDAARATIEHDRIVGSSLAKGVTPVPALLADPYEDDDETSTDLAAHAEAIRDALARMRGLVEMTAIVAMNDSPPAEGPGRGRAYLEQLRSQPGRAASIADRLAAEGRQVSEQSRRRVDGSRVAISHLVRRDQITDYRRLMIAQAGEGYRIVVDGPRAPYSFAAFSPRHGILSVQAASGHESGGLDRSETS